MVVSVLIASILAVVFIAFRVTVAAKSTQGGVVGTMLKALASLGFIAVGITAIYMGGITGNGINVKAAIFIVAGQIMGLIGDIVLDLKVVYLKSKEEGVYLTSGMASFGIGHILFFVAVILYFGTQIFDFGKFTVHSVCYAFVLLFMGAIGVAAWVKGAAANPHTPLFAVGMILFLLSDVVLTQMYFGGKAKDKVLCVVNHALYYAAQICIAAFVFYM